ncbi:hypothetical protein [Bacillus bingmayongensis]|uniref:hypothetical protein n=1 Tax=Bacillus bingmayongensis TaxID=1150157 RepID=UPI001ED9A43E|nr:hypothetical protein [Bacillus bingmayongensis]
MHAFFAVTIALFWDDPTADMGTEYFPMVMPHLYPVLIGVYLWLLSAVIFIRSTYRILNGKR